MAYFNGKEIFFSPKINITSKAEGTIEITENGEHDVAAYEKANVNVPVPTIEGILEITENGIHDVSKYAQAEVVVPLPEDKGDIEFTENGTHSVDGYVNNVIVNVPTSSGPEPPTLLANFADNTWEDIIWACQNNAVPSTWVKGDRKVMTFEYEEVTIAICGKNIDTYADGGIAPLTFCNVTPLNSVGKIPLADELCIFPFDASGMQNSVYGYAFGQTMMLIDNQNIKDSIRAVKKETPYQICPADYNSIDSIYEKWTKDRNYQETTIITTAEKLFLFSDAEAQSHLSVFNFFQDNSLDECWLRDNAGTEGYGYFKVMMMDTGGYDHTRNYLCTNSCNFLFGFCF